MKGRDRVLIIINEESQYGFKLKTSFSLSKNLQSLRREIYWSIGKIIWQLKCTFTFLIFTVETRIFIPQNKEWNAFGRRKVYWICVYTSRRKRSKGKNTNWTSERSTQNKEVCSPVILNWVFCNHTWISCHRL